MNVFRGIAEFKAWRSKLPSGVSIGFVPTMGALHEGHAALLAKSTEDSDITILSIFVNPTQFGPTEDLSRYPRTLEEDLALARRLRVDAVLIPEVTDVYPDGYSTTVEESEVSKPLCGVFRPGHFTGVATIVLKLFLWVKPHKAYFGLKDAQQFFVIQKMTQDLDLDVGLCGVETVREPSGLALSSRNRYLTEEQREDIAPKIYKNLLTLKESLLSKSDLGTLLAETTTRLQEIGFLVQYLEVRALPDLRLASDADLKQADLLIAFAGYLGKTRLIDNVILDRGKFASR